MKGLPRPHRVWLVPGLALALAANTVANDNGHGLVPVILFGVLPHLPVLLGIGQPRPRGHIGPRAVPLYNALHLPLVPAVVAGIALTGLVSSLWLVAGLAWLGHIVVDWGLGAGRRAPDGGPATGGRLALPLPSLVPTAIGSHISDG